jgi:8-oxo-dGTP pyrophosphatase MutT (NUDIX family)
MSNRSYAILDDTEKHVLVMGTKASGFLEGFLVLFGGSVNNLESSKEGMLRELKEESDGNVSCNTNDVSRFESFFVDKPKPANLFFYQCKNPTYTIKALNSNNEINSIIAVSVDKLLLELPDHPAQVTPVLVANALIKIYGGGADVTTYRKSGIMRALRNYLVKHYYN